MRNTDPKNFLNSLLAKVEINKLPINCAWRSGYTYDSKKIEMRNRAGVFDLLCFDTFKNFKTWYFSDRVTSTNIRVYRLEKSTVNSAVFGMFEPYLIVGKKNFKHKRQKLNRIYEEQIPKIKEKIKKAENNLKAFENQDNVLMIKKLAEEYKIKRGFRSIEDMNFEKEIFSRIVTESKFKYFVFTTYQYRKVNIDTSHDYDLKLLRKYKFI